jgi:CRP-like cAMP-binding protein
MIEEIINAIYPISAHSLKEIMSVMKYEDHDKGEVFIQKNKPNSKEYFLLDGICKSYLTSHEGDEITITFFNSKSVISPHTIRTRNNLSILSFQALTPLKLAAIDSTIFKQLMTQDIEIKNFANTVLSNELICKIDKEIDLATLTAKERLIKFRQKYPLFENLIPHPDIATYLGITNVSLSRLRKNIK